LNFEVDGLQYHMSHETFHNKNYEMTVPMTITLYCK
jgi:hypothetical protein